MTIGNMSPPPLAPVAPLPTTTVFKPKDTVEATRVKSALEYRKLVYREFDTFDQLLFYHRQWLDQTPIPRQTQASPAPETLDARGEDLPSDAATAIATDGGEKLHMDRYVYTQDTKAPPTDWQDAIPDLLALHDVNAGFLVVDLGLAPLSDDKTCKGFTWVTGFLDEKWAHYVKYSLDQTLICSTYMLSPEPWLKGETTEPSVASERLTHIHDNIRYFRRFPSEEPAICFRKFMHPVNPKLVERMATGSMLLTVIDHIPGRRNEILKLISKVLRNRNKLNNPNSRTKGLNFYVPAIRGLRKERDESQRLHFVKGIQNSPLGANMSIKELLAMPLNELRVKFWTFNNHL